MGRRAIGAKAMTAAERQRRRRAKSRKPVTLSSADEKAEDLGILREFQAYLDPIWPGWERWESRPMYNTMWRAFAAGWNARK
jgi:hypothetical protein